MNISTLLPLLKDSFPNASVQEDTSGISMTIYPMVIKIFGLANTVQCTLSITKRSKELLPISVISHDAESSPEEFVGDFKVQLKRFMLLSKACYKCSNKLLGGNDES